MMALDHVVATTTNDPKIVEESCDRTIRWIYRNIEANVNDSK